MTNGATEAGPARRRGRPPKPPTPRPRWQVVAVEAKRAALAALPDDEREAARLAQIEARARFAARREAKAAMIRDVVGRVLAGETLAEICAAIGRTKHSVRATCASLALPVSERKGYRRPPLIWLSDADSSSLDGLAADLGMNRADALAALLRACLSEAAFVARRTLGMRKRVA